MWGAAAFFLSDRTAHLVSENLSAPSTPLAALLVPLPASVGSPAALPVPLSTPAGYSVSLSDSLPAPARSPVPGTRPPFPWSCAPSKGRFFSPRPSEGQRESASYFCCGNRYDYFGNCGQQCGENCDLRRACDGCSGDSLTVCKLAHFKAVPLEEVRKVDNVFNQIVVLVHSIFLPFLLAVGINRSTKVYHKI